MLLFFCPSLATHQRNAAATSAAAAVRRCCVVADWSLVVALVAWLMFWLYSPARRYDDQHYYNTGEMRITIWCVYASRATTLYICRLCARTYHSALMPICTTCMYAPVCCALRPHMEHITLVMNTRHTTTFWSNFYARYSH